MDRKEEPVRGLSRGGPLTVTVVAGWQQRLLKSYISLLEHLLSDTARRPGLRKSNHRLEHFSHADTNKTQANGREPKERKAAACSQMFTSAELLIKCEENRKIFIYCLHLPICAQEI